MSHTTRTRVRSNLGKRPLEGSWLAKGCSGSCQMLKDSDKINLTAAIMLLFSTPSVICTAVDPYLTRINVDSKCVKGLT